MLTVDRISFFLDKYVPEENHVEARMELNNLLQGFASELSDEVYKKLLSPECARCGTTKVHPDAFTCPFSQ